MNDRLALALTLYGEARGEPIEGIIAVGCVIRNRTVARKKSYADICLEPKQFSCWNVGDPNYKLLTDIALVGKSDDEFFVQCDFIADGIINNKLRDNTRGAQYYLTDDLYYEPNLRPKWASSPKLPVSKGSQIFFSV